jgi:hypothetical protein
MVTRLLRLLRKRAEELSTVLRHETVWSEAEGKYVLRRLHEPEYLEILELIEHLELVEILDANPTKRRKWTHADTWLPAGCVLAIIEDEELAKNEH